MSKRALVTGADGFAGKFLCDHLVAQGWKVRSCVLAGPHDAETQIECDIRDRAQVDRMFDWAGDITHVFHLAAVTFIPETMSNPTVCMEANVLGTINMVEACRNFTPDARFVNVGSAGAYGPPASVPVTEEHPLNPEEPYSISKAAADQYCAFAHRAQGMDVIRARPFNHSGPGQSDRFVLPAFAKQIAEIEAGQRPPQLHVGDVNTARDFLHVTDVVRAYELAGLKGKPGEAYNICFGRSFKIKEALHILLALSSTDIEVVIEEDRLRPVDIQDVYGSHDKLTDHTGWRPEIPLKTLLAELLDDYRKQVCG